MSESPGAIMIADERSRQIEVEGYDSVHDDMHEDGELTSAAESYLLAANYCTEVRSKSQIKRMLASPPRFWMWEASAWKPSEDPIRNLVKAGALIAAEIDRLIRAKKNGKEEAES